MEKKNSVSAVTNEKVSTYISDDLSFSILSKLPLKSFKRFQCVRKSWSLLSENQPFMNVFRNNLLSNSPRYSYYDGGSLILKDEKNWKEVFYSFTGERFENKFKLDLSNPFIKNNDIFGFGSINGTLCIHRNGYADGKIVLWNPDTQTFKLLPPSEVELNVSSIPDEHKDSLSIAVISRLHGFGYDHVINDYKVLRHTEVVINFIGIDIIGRCGLEEMISVGFLGKKFGPSWEIYSLRSNSWREILVDMPCSTDQTEGTQVYMDGLYHWLCQNNIAYNQGYWKKHNIPFQPCLVSFYLSNEVFCITPIPLDVDDCYWRKLAVLNGTVALISYYEITTTFHISIMGEIGVKESWTNLFTIGPLPCVERPVGVGTKGEIFFIRNVKELAWFDLSSQMIEELGYEAGSFLRCRIINYKEIILPIEE